MHKTAKEKAIDRTRRLDIMIKEGKETTKEMYRDISNIEDEINVLEFEWERLMRSVGVTP